MFLFPPDPPPLFRTFKKHEVRSYRVNVIDNRADYTEKLDYRISLRCTDPGKDGSEAVYSFKIRDFHESLLDRDVRKGLDGAGTLSLAGYGLPPGLESDFKDVHFWLPLLDWFLPSEVKGGVFKTGEDLGDGLSLAGTGTVKDAAYELTGDVLLQGKSTLKATLNWSVGSDGWLAHGEGKVTALNDEEIDFTIAP